ncbi:hypothetical protein [Sphingomonas prati]|uniref:hypothetical protein n=1 Tax=Sphingomonas prati TaxID=1843237 RepID=UPI0018E029A2|nr:hypothetical protein [Sphingomonas prati]
MKYVVAIGSFILAAGCRDEPPEAASQNIEYRVKQHMAAAGRWCGVRDWHTLFSAHVVNERVRLVLRTPPPAGQPSPRANDMRCILNTFGTMTATNDNFEFPVSSLRSVIKPQRID